MNLANPTQLLDEYYLTVTSLTTGQTGKANVWLNRLLQRINPFIERMPAEKLAQVAPVVQSMLQAKERQDIVTLSDCLCYELPPSLADSELETGWFRVGLIEHLRALNPVLFQQRDNDTAVARLQQLVEKFGSDTSVSPYHAARLIAVKQFATAHRLLALEPLKFETHAVPCYLYAITSAHQGNFDEAVSLMENAYRLSPYLYDGFNHLGIAHDAIGQPGDALERFRQDQRHQRLSAIGEVNMAQLYAKVGDMQQATDLVESAYARDRRPIDGYVRLGWQLATKQQWQAALELGQHDESLGRLSPGWSVHLAQLYARNSDFDHAVELIDAAYARDASLRDGFVRLGRLKLGDGKKTEAIALFEKDAELGRLSAKTQSNLQDYPDRF